MMRFLTLAAAVLMTPVVAMADGHKIGDLTVERAVAKATVGTAMAGAGYLVISNAGDAADKLIAVEADFPRVMIHDTKVEDDVASMFHIDAVEIGAGETVTFQPRGKHIMFMGLDGDPIEEDETIAATLIFENAGRLDVTFEVATLEQIIAELGTGGGSEDHGDHSSHGN